MNTTDFWTSDTHFGHRKICEYSARPFSSVEEMDRELVRRWNAKVPKKATVWHLGDFAFLPAKDIWSLVSALNGTIHLLLGNHDFKRAARATDAFASVHQLVEGRLDGKRITLFHYPIHEWNGSHRGAWHLHGHSHGQCAMRRNRVDVGVDTHPHYEPFNYTELCTRRELTRMAPVPTHHGKFHE